MQREKNITHDSWLITAFFLDIWGSILFIHTAFKWIYTFLVLLLLFLKDKFLPPSNLWWCSCFEVFLVGDSTAVSRPFFRWSDGRSRIRPQLSYEWRSTVHHVLPFFSLKKYFSLLFQMYINEWERCFEWNVQNQYESMIIGLKQDDPSIFKYKSVMCKPWVWDHETMLVGVMEKGRLSRLSFWPQKNEKPYKGPPLLKKKILIAYACYCWSHVPDQGINSNQWTKKWPFEA